MPGQSHQRNLVGFNQTTVFKVQSAIDEQKTTKSMVVLLFELFFYFIFFNFSANVNVYCVADHSDATNANHKHIMPHCDNTFIKINSLDEIVSGVTTELIANNIKNSNIAII